MPRYIYRCEECDHEFEVVHSYGETVESCQDIECQSDKVRRMPQFINLAKPQEVQEQVGSLVRRHIEEARREVKETKQELKSDWTPKK